MQLKIYVIPVDDSVAALEKMQVKKYGERKLEMCKIDG